MSTHVKSSSKKVNFGNTIFKVETQRYCFLLKKFVILSETKQARQIDLFKMKLAKLVRITLNTSGNMLRLQQKAIKKRSERRKHCARAGCSKVWTPPARPLSQTHRQDRLQNTAPLASAQCKEPIGGLKIHTESGDKAIAEKDDRKAEVLCDFFSSVFCTENDTVFPVLSNKECDVASEPPNFDLDDIINRLNKT